MSGKIEVGILGATGTVGQRFVQRLEDHPWFEARWLAASDRSAGKSYREATSWQLEGAPPAGVADRIVEECVPGRGPRLVFSSMASSLAGEIERDFARAGHIVVSNSSHYRMAPDVPLLVPEINPGHLGLLPVQRRERGWEGAIVTNPNCAAVTVVKYTTDIPRLGHWGEPFLLGPGSIHVAHTPEERIAKRELIEAVHLYRDVVRGLQTRGSGGM